MSEIKILHLGVEEYSTVFEKMKKLQERRIEDEITDTLIFVIHPAVSYTHLTLPTNREV